LPRMANSLNPFNMSVSLSWLASGVPQDRLASYYI
jgi:hypothetical protein